MSEKMAWFRAAKFGMFIHWGLYALPAGEWKGRAVPHVGEWIMKWEKIPRAEYEQLAHDFNPVQWDAAAVAQLAADAGMRYLVITAKHHDGFAMYDSAVSDYDIVDATPFKRDPLKELETACADRGIRYGFYYSHAQDWHEPNAAGNEWDFPTPTRERDYSQYLRDKAMPQVQELLQNYGPLGLIWFDTPALLTREQALALQELVRTEQPDCIVNSRIGHGGGDYEQMGDNEVPSQVYPHDWEVPATLNGTWGNKKNDHNWKSAGNLIYRLTDIVSKGGNYLLNIGPRADGSLPDETIQNLREVGRWLKVNGESIYETTPSPFALGEAMWRCTAHPGKLYLHLLAWPGEQFHLHGLENDITRATLLADPERRELPWSREGNRLTVTLPATPPDPYNSVLVLEIDGTPRVEPAYRWDAPTDRITLTARDSGPHGPFVTYDEAGDAVHRFFRPNDKMRWNLIINTPGTYTAELEYACDASLTGVPFRIAAGEAQLFGTLTDTGGAFQRVSAGTLLLEKPGPRILQFSLPEPPGDNGLRVRAVRLCRRNSDAPVAPACEHAG